jgi:hypothetical protein
LCNPVTGFYTKKFAAFQLKIGYSRVSSDDQNLALQLDEEGWLQENNRAVQSHTAL